MISPKVLPSFECSSTTPYFAFQARILRRLTSRLEQQSPEPQLPSLPSCARCSAILGIHEPDVFVLHSSRTPAIVYARYSGKSQTPVYASVFHSLLRHHSPPFAKTSIQSKHASGCPVSHHQKCVSKHSPGHACIVTLPTRMGNKHSLACNT